MNPVLCDDDVIVLFKRFPVPGKAKTRLVPTPGPEGAADLQRRMTEYTLRQAKRTGARIEIRYVDGTLDGMRAWLGANNTFADQGPGDLGRRMAAAFDRHFRSGARRVVVIGSDCPDNRCSNHLRCFSLLDAAPCVIGPAMDGGYYMIGLDRPQPELFSGIDWGTADVLRQTRATASQRVALLPVLRDVDEKKTFRKRSRLSFQP